MLRRTRVVNTLIVLLTVAVVCLAILPWLIPRIQEAARDKPDPGRVLTAIREHQVVLDAEWTDTEVSTGASPPTRAETTIGDLRKRLAQDGIPVTSATSKVKRIRATYQDDDSVHAIAEVSTSKTYADGSGTTSLETNRHDLTLTGNDTRGYSVVGDEIVDPARPSPPDDIRHRADLMALGVSIVFAAIAVVAVVLSRRNRACLLRRSAWLPCGGAGRQRQHSGRLQGRHAELQRGASHFARLPAHPLLLTRLCDSEPKRRSCSPAGRHCHRPHRVPDPAEPSGADRSPEPARCALEQRTVAPYAGYATVRQKAGCQRLTSSWPPWPGPHRARRRSPSPRRRRRPTRSPPSGRLAPR